MSILGRKSVLAAFVFGATLLAHVSYVNNIRLLETCCMAEEHFLLGRIAYRNLPVGIFRGAELFRPPGYGAFVYLTLGTADLLGLADTTGLTPEESEQLDKRIVAFGHCLLTSTAVLLLFLWFSRFLRPLQAAGIALSYGLVPWTLIDSGLLNYHSLHVLFLVAACYALGRALEAGPFPHKRWILAAGIVWGLTTLIRPSSLLLPAFAALAFAIQSNPRDQRSDSGGSPLRWLKPTALSVLLFSLGTALVILPWTARNYWYTGQVIPVNAQGGIALWAATETKLPPPNNGQNWYKLWFNQGMETFTAVTGESKYSAEAFYLWCVELDAAFKRRAKENIVKQPDVFLHNILVNLWGVLSQYPFQVSDATHSLYDPPAPTEPARTYRHNKYLRWTHALTLHCHCLSLVALLALAVGVVRRDPFLLGLTAVQLTFCVGHAITFVELRYLYFKVPLLFILLAYGMWDLERGLRRYLSPMAAGAVVGAANLSILALGWGLTVKFLMMCG